MIAVFFSSSFPSSFTGFTPAPPLMALSPQVLPGNFFPILAVLKVLSLEVSEAHSVRAKGNTAAYLDHPMLVDLAWSTCGTSHTNDLQTLIGSEPKIRAFQQSYERCLICQ